MTNPPRIHQSFTIRRTSIVLLAKLVVIQALIVILYVAFRIVKSSLFVSAGITDGVFWAGIVVFMAFMLLQMLLTILAVFHWKREQFTVLPDSVVHTRGLFTNHEDVYSLRGVEAGKVSQGVFGRFLDYGTVSLYSPVLKREYFLRDIPSPEAMKQRILTLIAEKDKTGERLIPITPIAEHI